jgi:hypothetical protein
MRKLQAEHLPQSPPLVKWSKAEIVLYAFVLSGAVICYFFITHSVLLFRIANVIILGAHVSTIVKAAHGPGSGALRVSLFFFALGIVYKFPISLT